MVSLLTARTLLTRNGVEDSVVIVKEEGNYSHIEICYNTIIADGHTHYCLVAAAGSNDLLISNNTFTGDGEIPSLGEWWFRYHAAEPGRRYKHNRQHS